MDLVRQTQTELDNLAECSVDGSWKIDGNEIVSD